MHRITIRPSGRVVSVSPGTTLLDGLLAAAVPVASSCRGEGVCHACRVRVMAGAEHLSAPDEREQNAARDGKLAGDERLACLARPLGPITLTTSYW